ncbi:PREDICTED: uncharacterized protein LOC106814888 [Priapulus caudatus]|uniref:Uncharacterized protein LOC106814888 n=1 Tax=Priapulus caudatus TaxID=37621 RepID=A0ABM1ERC6_PRICU|nr:PREDICTED: uncharacterized protein LOC106814888 [Priapulus caudatus]
MGNYKTVFPLELEKDLVDYVLHLETLMYGLTTNDVRNLAYQLAVRNGLPNSFNKDKEKAGKDWLLSFMKRHPAFNPKTTQDAMIQCTVCLQWAHTKCAGTDEDTDDFICDFCA